MPDLHTWFFQEAPNQLQCQRLSFGGAFGAEVILHGVDDFPQTDVVLMTLFDQTFQGLVRSHVWLPSISELDLLDRDWLSRVIDHLDVNGLRATLGGRSITDSPPPVGKLDQFPRIARRGDVFAAPGQLLEDTLGLGLPSGDFAKPR
jgi:hypothetical protein